MHVVSFSENNQEFRDTLKASEPGLFAGVAGRRGEGGNAATHTDTSTDHYNPHRWLMKYTIATSARLTSAKMTR